MMMQRIITDVGYHNTTSRHDGNIMDMITPNNGWLPYIIYVDERYTKWTVLINYLSYYRDTDWNWNEIIVYIITRTDLFAPSPL